MLNRTVLGLVAGMLICFSTMAQEKVKTLEIPPSRDNFMLEEQIEQDVQRITELVTIEQKELNSLRVVLLGAEKQLKNARLEMIQLQRRIDRTILEYLQDPKNGFDSQSLSEVWPAIERINFETIQMPDVPSDEER